MDANFVRTQLASGLYAKGQQVAVSVGEFELSVHDTRVRQQNRIKYGQDTTEEDKALAALGGTVDAI